MCSKCIVNIFLVNTPLAVHIMAAYRMMLHIMLANTNVAKHITTFDDLAGEIENICINIVL